MRESVNRELRSHSATSRPTRMASVSGRLPRWLIGSSVEKRSAGDRTHGRLFILRHVIKS